MPARSLAVLALLGLLSGCARYGAREPPRGEGADAGRSSVEATLHASAPVVDEDEDDDVPKQARPVPLADGSVLRLLSSLPTADGVSYRAIVAQAGEEPGRNLYLVFQKLRRGAASFELLDQLVVAPADLPSADETGFDWDSPLRLDKAAFRIGFTPADEKTQSCSLALDASSSDAVLSKSKVRCNGRALAGRSAKVSFRLYDGIPLASGRVTRIASHHEDGRMHNYRVLVANAAFAPEDGMKIVFQKTTHHPKKYTLDSQLTLGPDALPGNRAAVVGPDQRVGVDATEYTDALAVYFADGARCSLGFDIASVGTSMERRYLTCKRAPAR